ncbi:ribosome biogenesis ATPase RIX7 [Lecanosticta acicola]|uniref:Ribosome biogenesis ATPase RIX7 n=1 Tax=Lecanosticta acicola TaxID=111012 RepID=A0AAI9E6E0_9PEZI|nr:ribosome biogenesis ATPase RIX7 [Lecanosticta acicola]
MRLQGALDNEVHIAVQKFLAEGIPANTPAIYAALQKSNSSLKRRPKRVIEASIERVIEFLGVLDDGHDSDAVIEDAPPEDDLAAQQMNKALRANLAPTVQTPTANSEDAPRKRKANGESLPKRPKIATNAPQDISLDDIGGMDDVIQEMERNVLMPLLYSDIYEQTHVPQPRGILLHGPPGCGKTMLARAVAAELEIPFIEMLGPSIVSGMSGESEKGVRDRFEEAKKNAPCMIFIDEIDAIAPKRDSSQSQMEKRIVAQLLVSMDELQQNANEHVIVLAATNRPDSIDPALRRGGRFGTEININVPNEQVRQRILQRQTRKIPLAPDVDFLRLAKMTAGFVGADLQDLVGKAGAHQMERYRSALKRQAVELGLEHQSSQSSAVMSFRCLKARGALRAEPMPAAFEIRLTMHDFLDVLPGITPSSKREGFSTIPDVSWEDIGALDIVRKQLTSAIVDPIEHPEEYERLGRTSPSGVLLWGPPGCGKTLLAKAVAAESKANFISIKGPELLNKFVGESEAAVRKVFHRARSSVPCVIFFDELDALVPRRDDSGSEASARVVNTLLTELDGLSVRAGIYVVGATNRPDMIDEAMLRPGRFGTQLFVDVPGPEERVSIMKALLRNKPCEWTAEMAEIVRGGSCTDFTGADLQELINEAIASAFDRKASRIEVEDFYRAAEQVKGSVSDTAKYRALKKRFGRN